MKKYAKTLFIYVFACFIFAHLVGDSSSNEGLKLANASLTTLYEINTTKKAINKTKLDIDICDRAIRSLKVRRRKTPLLKRWPLTKKINTEKKKKRKLRRSLRKLIRQLRNQERKLAKQKKTQAKGKAQVQIKEGLKKK